ncbi:MAG: tetratricopeptide repeat protein [Treponema sp.]
MEKSDQTLLFSEKCTLFLTRNQKVLVGILAILCVTIAGAFLYAFFGSHKTQNASEAIEAVITDWIELYAKKPEDLATQEDALATLLETKAQEYAHTYAAFRAYSVLGEIFTLRKDWQKALDYYQKAAEVLPHAYTAGVAYFNAAVCADELQQFEKSLHFYTLAAQIEDFPLKPRALFNIGRTEEALAHNDKAIEAYTKLEAAYPDNSWALLGKSRIIALTLHN